MKIVIEIDEEVYSHAKDVKNRLLTPREEIVLQDSVANGTPLPKHHGRLIDADWVKNTLDIYVLNEYNGQFIRRSDIDSIPTIIEADGGEEE